MSALLWGNTDMGGARGQAAGKSHVQVQQRQSALEKAATATKSAAPPVQPIRNAFGLHVIIVHKLGGLMTHQKIRKNYARVGNPCDAAGPLFCACRTSDAWVSSWVTRKSKNQKVTRSKSDYVMITQSIKVGAHCCWAPHPRTNGLPLHNQLLHNQLLHNRLLHNHGILLAGHGHAIKCSGVLAVGGGARATLAARTCLLLLLPSACTLPAGDGCWRRARMEGRPSVYSRCELQGVAG